MALNETITWYKTHDGRDYYEKSYADGALIQIFWPQDQGKFRLIEEINNKAGQPKMSVRYDVSMGRMFSAG